MLSLGNRNASSRREPRLVLFAVVALCAVMVRAAASQVPGKSSGDVGAGIVNPEEENPLLILRSNPDPARRVWAAGEMVPHALMACRTPVFPEWRVAEDQAVPALVRGLLDPAPSVRAVCCDSLGAYGDLAAPAVPALERLLYDKDTKVRLLAMDALGAIGEDAAPALAALREIARTGNEVEALRADAAIITMTGQTYGYLEPLIKALGPDQPENIRVDALYILDATGVGRRGEEAVPALLGIVSDRTSPDFMRALSANALCEVAVPIDAGRVASAMLAALPEAKGALRFAILSDLGDFPSQRDRIMPALVEVLGSNASAQDKAATVDSLAKLGCASPRIDGAMLACKDYDSISVHVYNYLASLDEPSADFLPRAEKAIEAADGSSPEVSMQGAAAVRYLARLAHEPAHCGKALALALEAAKSEDANVRFAAVEGLGSAFPTSMQSVVRQLREALKDSDAEVVRRAVVSLGQVEPPATEAVPDLEKLKAGHDSAEAGARDIAAGYLPLADLLDNSLAAVQR